MATEKPRELKDVVDSIVAIYFEMWSLNGSLYEILKTIPKEELQDLIDKWEENKKNKE